MEIKPRSEFWLRFYWDYSPLKSEINLIIYMYKTTYISFLFFMIITFYGENCFKIQSGELTILTDPLDPKSGLSAARFKYDGLIKTLSPFPPASNASGVANAGRPESEQKEEAVVMAGPGEYNFHETDVYGYLLDNESSENFIKTVYLATIEDLKLCFLGHLSDTPPPSVMEHLEEVDILFIPAGGEPFIDQKKAVKLIRQIQPKIAIPTFFKVPGLSRKTEKLDVFLSEFNHKKPEEMEKLTIKKKDVSAIKPTQLVILKI